MTSTSESAPESGANLETLPAAATTAVPAPGGGNINETVAPVEVSTAASVALTAPAEFGDGVTAKIVDVVAIEGEAVGPGEISGPALQVTVEMTNGTDQSVDLSAVTLTLGSGPDNVPASQLLADPHVSQFVGVAKPGATVNGTYVFSVPVDVRANLQLTLSYSGSSPIVIFSGSLE